ncbi:hypothetical protein LTR53_009577 [Teratosphaeriaceae sp. CCFEE 6253]|nr:hypothetical protein LTR53_009577 [Teratosphaeriaceae sp. CCFEE 6253]
MDALPTTNATTGAPESLPNRLLETGAGLLQPLHPPKRLCAHLNAFHTYAAQPGRHVEANHYCAHVNDEVRQCLLYDSDAASARLIGVEYMITQRLYETLDAEERSLWHSHVFEVKSGMLVMPTPPYVPASVWEVAETKEMEQVVGLYGKVFHLWQTDRGDKLPLGKPELMMSFTARDQFDFDKVVGERDARFGVDFRHKAEIRRHIQAPEVHADADRCWRAPGEGQGQES